MSVVSKTDLAKKGKIGRFVDNPAETLTGIPGELPVPSFIARAYDKYILGKKEDKVTEPPKAGGMKYRDSFYDNERARDLIDQLTYRMAAEDARRELPFYEVDIHDLQRIGREALGSVPYMIEGLEHNGDKAYIAKNHPDGTPRTGKEKAKTLIHEKRGARYTRAGMSHEDNHPAIERDTEAELKSYMTKAAKLYAELYAN